MINLTPLAVREIQVKMKELRSVIDRNTEISARLYDSEFMRIYYELQDTMCEFENELVKRLPKTAV